MRTAIFLAVLLPAVALGACAKPTPVALQGQAQGAAEAKPKASPPKAVPLSGTATATGGAR